MDMGLPLPIGAKCTRCREQATIRMTGHNANFCDDCFRRYFLTGVERAMKKFPLTRETPLIVAVSGGKDSLAVWAVLQELGYSIHGLHLDLGIEEFSNASADAVADFARKRSLTWTRRYLKEVVGYSIPELKKATRRKICSVCGFLKRQLLNRLTITEGRRHLVSGHNLDDEAGRMLGNIVRHRTQYFEKQYPYLPSNHPRIPEKAKPLYRLEAWEIRLYCELEGISPVEAKCPLSQGATSHAFKEALDLMEERMPGTKRNFLFTYIDRREPPKADLQPKVCVKCGEPAFLDVCSVCNLLGQVHPRESEADPVDDLSSHV